MTDGPAGALPNAGDQAFYRSVLAQGGRVAFREAVEENGPAVLRLLESGLLVHRAEEGSLAAVDPRIVARRMGERLRETGTGLLVQAQEVPQQLAGLSEAYEAAPCASERAGGVQHLTGLTEIRHRLLQIEADSTTERLSARRGFRLPDHLAEGADRTRRFIEQGGEAKVIYDASARTAPGTVEYATEATRWGMRVRVLDEPFTRMIVCDRRVAVVPAAPDNTVAAFIEDPAVVRQLVGIFERDWARAERVQWGSLRDPGGPPAHEQVGRLLAQGLTQRAVASRLGVSERTVAGHIARLRELYDAETLFQLGWLMKGENHG